MLVILDAVFGDVRGPSAPLRLSLELKGDKDTILNTTKPQGVRLLKRGASRSIKKQMIKILLVTVPSFQNNKLGLVISLIPNLPNEKTNGGNTHSMPMGKNGNVVAKKGHQHYLAFK